jgi:DNA-binding response OmpR family regulator
MLDMQRILLAEDDRTIVEGLSYALGQEGFEICAAYSQGQAVRLLEEQSFDLALLDLSLPDGSGYDICRFIKQHSPDTKVIFLTACDEETSVVMGLDMGADDYVTKPFRLRELMSRIRTVLRRGACSAGDELRLGEVGINTRQAKVAKKGTEIILTALEYRLLLTFAQNPGRLLRRGQLLDGIWDVAGNFVNDNTLTVYIKRLRDKIEDDPQNPLLIQTVRGLGYRAGD